MKHSDNAILVVRGIHSDQQNLTIAIRQWQQLLEDTGSSSSVEIDPHSFHLNQIHRVPAVSLRINGTTKLTAFGVTSVEWLMREYRAGKRGNLGIYGPTYPISEVDIMELLLHRLRDQDWRSVLAKAEARIQNKVLSYGVKLPPSQHSSSHLLKISGSWNTP